MLQNVEMEFVRVVKAFHQVVAGSLHFLTVEVLQGGETKYYEARVYSRPWEDKVKLEGFRPTKKPSSPKNSATFNENISEL